MESVGTSLPALRVIVLARDVSLRLELGSLGAAVVQVATPYEAAAEALAQPAAVAVVDLRLLTPRHLRLLEILRSRRVEVLALGSPAGGVAIEQLSGVRLMAREHLKSAVERLRAERVTPVSDLDAELARMAPGGEPQPAFRPQRPPAEQPAAPAPEKPQQAAPQARLAAPHAPDADMRSILTPEELSALLEDER